MRKKANILILAAALCSASFASPVSAKAAHWCAHPVRVWREPSKSGLNADLTTFGLRAEVKF